ncbi:MAG: hypothetical protein WB762_18515 [Candidatus Sulfotelmatobacter sp.]
MCARNYSLQSTFENQLRSFVDDRRKHIDSPAMKGDLFLDFEVTLESRSFQRAFRD